MRQTVNYTHAQHGIWGDKMARYTRKTKDRWDIETNYGTGWEVEDSEYNYDDARRNFAEYLMLVRAYNGRARLVKRRERI